MLLINFQNLSKKKELPNGQLFFTNMRDYLIIKQ